MKSKKYKVAVVNGRFEIFHKGHWACVLRALDVAKQVIIIVGSANASRSITNPFTAEERISVINRMLVNKLSKHDYNRVKIAIVNDNIRDTVWQADVRDCVYPHADKDVIMVGANKDADSWWLDVFGWDVESVDIYKDNNGDSLSSSWLRDVYFKSNVSDFTPIFEQYVSWEQIYFLNRFAHSEPFKKLKADYDYKVSELKKFDSYPYKGTLNCSTADAVVICNGHVLVTTRGNMPGLGLYALPGGHKNDNETYLDCAIRELREEIKLHVPLKVIRGSIKDQKMFDAPKRSSVMCKPTLGVYIELLPDANGSLPRIDVGEEIAKVEWMPLNIARRSQNRFFDDHWQIISYFTGL